MDNSTALRSQVLKNMLDKWNVSRFFRAASRPSGNGIVERHLERQAAFKCVWRRPSMPTKTLRDEVGTVFIKIVVVWVKPSNARCTSRWERGTVTDVTLRTMYQLEGCHMSWTSGEWWVLWQMRSQRKLVKI